MAASYDVIVIGLGAMGSAAVYQLAARGRRVLGIDMFPLGHNHGSSHGDHRMIRRSAGRAVYLPLAARAFDAWRALEGESGYDILTILGEIGVRDPRLHVDGPVFGDDPTLGGMLELLDARQLAERFPGVRLGDRMIATYEAEAGIVRPEVAVRAQLEMAERRGATIRRPEEVVGWAVDGDGVRVETTRDRYAADRLIVTPGPWAPELLGDLNPPLEVVRIVNGYFTPARPDWWTAERGAPNFSLSVPEGHYYGMPAMAGLGLKIGRHDNGEPTTARTIRRDVDPAEVAALGDVLDRYLPGARGPVVKTITCMYTNTPDADFIVDRHPAHEQVVIGCGFSGTGFKFSCVIGEILADLALDGRTRYGIEDFSWRRFAGSAPG